MEESLFRDFVAMHSATWLKRLILTAVLFQVLPRFFAEIAIHVNSFSFICLVRLKWWGFNGKLASASGKEELTQRVPNSLNLSNNQTSSEPKMGRKKIQISRINDERNRQVPICFLNEEPWSTGLYFNSHRCWKQVIENWPLAK